MEKRLQRGVVFEIHLKNRENLQLEEGVVSGKHSRGMACVGLWIMRSV
jgi:hypothetical protein